MSEITGDRLRISTEFDREIPSELCQSEVVLPGGPDSRLYSQRKGGALGIEQLLMLQTRIMEAHAQKPFTRLLITSAVRGEGKTHVAANLAIALATEGHRKVLLLDTDLRNPSMHSVLSIPNSQGLKEWLLNGGDPWQAVRRVERTELYVMTAGTAACDTFGPSRIPCLQTLLDHMGPAFDLIVLDAPPLLGVFDAKLLSSIADAILMVVGAGATPRGRVLEAQKVLEGQNVLGVVLNRIDPKESCFSSYYSYAKPENEPSSQNGHQRTAPAAHGDALRILDGKRANSR